MISAITDDWSSAKLLRSVALARLPGAAAVAIALSRVKAEPSSTWLGGGFIAGDSHPTRGITW